MANDCVGKIIKPVVLIGSSRERMVGVVVDSVDVIPQVWNHVARAVHPVHAERHDVVIQVQPDQPLKHDLTPVATSVSARRFVEAQVVVVPSALARQHGLTCAVPNSDAAGAG